MSMDIKKTEVTNDIFTQELLAGQRVAEIERKILEAINKQRVGESLEALANIIIKISKQV